VIVTTRMGVNRQESALCTRMALAKGRLVGGPTFAILSLLILGLTAVLGLAACAPDQPAPEKAIVGQWVNSRAGVIYIPGDERQTPPIPSVKFSYYFQDDVHLGIKMDGQNPIVIEIKLEDDKMTWLNRDNNVEYVYTKMN
jgi:hypothetical protein